MDGLQTDAMNMIFSKMHCRDILEFCKSNKNSRFLCNSGNQYVNDCRYQSKMNNLYKEIIDKQTEFNSFYKSNDELADSTSELNLDNYLDNLKRIAIDIFLIVEEMKKYNENVIFLPVIHDYNKIVKWKEVVTPGRDDSQCFINSLIPYATVEIKLDTLYKKSLKILENAILDYCNINMELHEGTIEYPDTIDDHEVLDDIFHIYIMFEDFCSRNMNDDCKDVITDILIMSIPTTVHSPEFHMVLNHITEDQFDATRLFQFAQRLGYKGMKTKSNVYTDE